MKKQAKKEPSKFDLTKPTATVVLKHPFLHGSKQIREITLRTAAYTADVEEMDDAEGEKAKITRLISSLSDVDQDGKGIPHAVLSEKLRFSDYSKLAGLAGEILAEDDLPEIEGKEVDPKKGSAENIRAIGGTSQQ